MGRPWFIWALVLAVGTNSVGRSADSNENYEDYDQNNTEYNNEAYNQQSNNNQSNDNRRGKVNTRVAKSEGDEEGKIDLTDKLPHPSKASKWRTSELILTNKLPLPNKLDACLQEVYALSEKAINEEMMITSRNILTQSIVRESELYHWCFYVGVNRADARIDASQPPKTFHERYATFIIDMKALWILARALDISLHSKKYFGYLRKRYLDLALEYFGKDLTVISAPLGDKERRVPRLQPKAAFPEFDDY